jgi:hypothetical protein
MYLSLPVELQSRSALEQVLIINSPAEIFIVAMAFSISIENIGYLIILEEISAS